MTVLQMLGHFLGIDDKELSNEKGGVLEAELYNRAFHKIWEAYTSQHNDYFELTKSYLLEEVITMDSYVIRSMICDVLESGEYTMSGIASYTQTPVEVIEDILIEQRVSPIVIFIRKLVELHKSVRPDVYKAIFRDILRESLDDEKKIATKATNQEQYYIEYVNQPNQSDVQTLSDGIIADAKFKKNQLSSEFFAFFVRDAKQQLRGGCNGSIYYGCLYIEQLWLDEPLRRLGIGTQLMQRVERLAKEKRCLFATVNTMDRDALEFYKKFGFEVEYERTGYLNDITLYFLRKSFYSCSIV